MLINLMVEILLQYNIANYYVGHLKYISTLFVNYASLKLTPWRYVFSFS